MGGLFITNQQHFKNAAPHPYSIGILIFMTMVMISPLTCLATEPSRMDILDARADNSFPNANSIPTGGVSLVSLHDGTQTHTDTGTTGDATNGNGVKDINQIASISSFNVYYTSSSTTYYETCSPGSTCISGKTLTCSTGTWSSTYTTCYTDLYIEAGSGWYFGTYISDASGGTSRFYYNWGTQDGLTYASISSSSIYSPGVYSYGYSCSTLSSTRYVYLRVYCFAESCTPTITFDTFWAASKCGMTWRTSSSCSNCVNTTTADCYYTSISASAPDDSICTSAIGTSPAGTGYCTNGLQYTTSDWSSCDCDSETQTRTVSCSNANSCTLPSSYCSGLTASSSSTSQSCSKPSSCAATTIALAVSIPVGTIILLGSIFMVVRKYKQYNKPKDDGKATGSSGVNGGGINRLDITSPTSFEIVSPQKTIPSGPSITVSQPDGNGGYYINTMASPAGGSYVYPATYDPTTGAPPPNIQVYGAPGVCSFNTCHLILYYPMAYCHFVVADDDNRAFHTQVRSQKVLVFRFVPQQHQVRIMINNKVHYTMMIKPYFKMVK
jgi:hypothetical protein